jgi:sensor histidine kinase regulating citrate/malate metabolism
LSNLLNNAYESLRDKRKIIIRIDDTKNQIVLTVVDFGCGIPKNKIDSVLRGESLKAKGHGIGLSSAFQYMQSIGGQLLLRSNEKEGTEIQLFFPKEGL